GKQEPGSSSPTGNAASGLSGGRARRPTQGCPASPGSDPPRNADIRLQLLEISRSLIKWWRQGSGSWPIVILASQRPRRCDEQPRRNDSGLDLVDGGI